MNAREEILGRIERVAPRRDAAEVAASYDRIARDYLRRHHDDGVLDLFAERVADYRAMVRRVTPDELPGAVAELLAARPGVHAVPDGLPAGWIAAADAAALAHAPAVADLDGMAGAVTGCTAAIAETGTIVLDHGPAQGPRALSLVPDYHLIVVRAGQVAPDVPEALERLDARRPLTFVSGPSATSDIELSRVEGVHGPRTLEVLLVEDGGR
ncbi:MULTISPECIES: LutC/YkgG family protein [Thermomonosporaceae]|uniref:LutC/YkgG family protein n=1 Tax=Thermomonosporaceae TaxID=2012 RepID=UPI00255B1B16|nr:MULTISPECIES: LUD domain-containing protein [Thermomonosporaceae]MDL4774433.1 LUD domain-containing protein [Actinomadura xylanilytica]